MGRSHSITAAIRNGASNSRSAWCRNVGWETSQSLVQPKVCKTACQQPFNVVDA